ncbi:MAG: (d)CMP kinase [Oscillospiraceae bacterium]|nr:(d)CMP kinase [Oscillospiraceae bacterium]
MFKIAIDGPSGAGKSTLAKNIAAALGFMYLDTGALYRTIGLYNYQNKDLDLSKINVRAEYVDGKQIMYLNGVDVTAEIRRNEISLYASEVSAKAEVRAFLLDIQRNAADNYNIVMDGRDIGTVIMPDAQVKIFLCPNVEERAKRRYAELIAKGQNITFEEVFTDMERRDKNDSSRNIAPAVAAADAVLIDNSSFTEEETLNAAMKIIDEKLKKYGRK